jgi:hypothetical protein
VGDVQKPLHHATEEQAGNGGVATRAHDDQIGPELLSRIGD